jgi:hypothetical protein
MKKSKHLVDMNKKIQETDFDLAGAVNFLLIIKNPSLMKLLKFQ